MKKGIARLKVVNRLGRAPKDTGKKIPRRKKERTRERRHGGTGKELKMTGEIPKKVNQKKTGAGAEDKQ